jgi:hypothetical protein
MEQAEEEGITVNEWKCIVQRNLAFQRYVFRRAWGAYYSMTAAVIALFIFLSMAGLEVIAGLILGLTVLLALIVATVLLFRKAYRTVELRQTIKKDRWERHRKILVWPWVIIFFTAIIVSALLLPSYFYLVLYAAEIPLVLIAWYGLKLSFLDNLPIESVLAMSFYALTIVLSFILSFIGEFFGISTSASFLWVGTVLIFFFASIYALLRAPDELEVLVKE